MFAFFNFFHNGLELGDQSVNRILELSDLLPTNLTSEDPYYIKSTVKNTKHVKKMAYLIQKTGIFRDMNEELLKTILQNVLNNLMANFFGILLQVTPNLRT